MVKHPLLSFKRCQNMHRPFLKGPLLFKYGSNPTYVYPFHNAMTNIGSIKMEKWRWCIVWDSNPRLWDCRRRQIHWASKTPRRSIIETRDSNSEPPLKCAFDVVKTSRTRSETTLCRVNKYSRAQKKFRLDFSDLLLIFMKQLLQFIFYNLGQTP